MPLVHISEAAQEDQREKTTDLKASDLYLTKIPLTRDQLSCTRRSMRESNGPKASDLYLTKSRISRFYVNVAFWSTAGTEFGKTGDADSAIVSAEVSELGNTQWNVFGFSPQIDWKLSLGRLERHFLAMYLTPFLTKLVTGVVAASTYSPNSTTSYMAHNEQRHQDKLVVSISTPQLDYGSNHTVLLRWQCALV